MASPRLAKKTKKKASRGGGPSKAQQEWMSKLGEIADASPPGGLEEDDGGETTAPSKLDAKQVRALEGAVKQGIIPPIPGLPGGEIPGKVIDVIAGARASVVRVVNGTGQPLTLDPISLQEVNDIGKSKKIGISDGSEYKKLPPQTIAPGTSNTEFIVVAQSTFGLSFRGAEARLRYFLDDKKTAWIIHFDNSPFKKAKADRLLDGPNKNTFTSPNPQVSDGKTSVFTFILDGGPGGGKKPGGGGGGEVDATSNCIVKVNNKTDQEMTLVDQGHDRGDFMSFPPATLAPGGSGQFVSVETPNSKDQGCKGFIEYEIGSPSKATCRLDWDNPEQKKNTTKTTITPSNSPFKILDQIGQGEENVPVAFTISGSGGGGGEKPKGKKPPPGTVPPEKEKEEKFEPPVEVKQPTLRKGDKTKDGWVEYLQRALNFLVKAQMEVDGNFGMGTHRAVLKFQKKKNLMVDGVVGNQTWAAIRSDNPEPPSTDGRAPHSHVEEGAEARWDNESAQNNLYDKKADEFLLAIASVGADPIDDFKATVRITPPRTKSKTVTVTIGKPVKKSKTGAGHKHMVLIKKFKKTFPAKNPEAEISDYLVEAYLPKELGGDFYKANIKVR